MTFSQLMELHRDYWGMKSVDGTPLRFGQFVVNSQFPESGEAMSHIFYETNDMKAFDTLLEICVEG